MELSQKFQSERMAVNYALELSDRYRDFFFYVFRRNDGTFLVDNAGIRYDDETLIAIYHNTEQI